MIFHHGCSVSQSRLKDLEKELAELQDKFRSMKAKWENEKNAIGKVQSLREQIEQTNADIEKAQREYDLNKAAELKYGKLPQLQKQLEEEEKIAAAKKEDSLLRDRVTDEEIARIVARWTGIPVEKLVEGEREKLLHLDDVLHQRVIGKAVFFLKKFLEVVIDIVYSNPLKIFVFFFNKVSKCILILLC